MATTLFPSDEDNLYKIPALSSTTIVCFSHLRWNFVFQRPQHLMTRFAAKQTVIYWEEPVIGKTGARAILEAREDKSGVTVVVPHLPSGLSADETTAQLRSLLDNFLVSYGRSIVCWYYTPMMLAFSRHLEAEAVVYDCMDELANFKFASSTLAVLERELLSAADVVFTGGYALYEAKKGLHSNIHAFPSSVDRAHFGAARSSVVEPVDQQKIPGPRLGFYGVIDERMDLELLGAVADARPEWSIVLVGPVAKIDQAQLPQRANIFYLGGKTYDQLPAYVGGWDVALMPFAINEATRFISPTKTPEYLAAGVPVVSTPITDVIRHYGHFDAVKIADTAKAFVAACEAALAMRAEGSAWLNEVDEALGASSWDKVQSKMSALIEQALRDRAQHRTVARLPRTKQYNVLIVGAGFAGSVMAERLASDMGKRVLVVDRRPHIAGNAFDHFDEAGILVHKYGPHIFHTNSTDVFAYLSRFTEWRQYEHRVLADVDGMLVPMPINRTTLNALYDLSLTTDAEAEAFLASRAEPVETVVTSADVVISAIGRELYETFFQGYTRKQWGMDPSELDKSVTARVPTRTNIDDRYFTDSYQAMPADGYTKMFANMLDHPNIEVMLGVDFKDLKGQVTYDHLVFTGPIDEYFGHRYGKLPYRSLQFEHVTHEVEQFQSVGTVNYPSQAVPYTRISEYKYLTGQVAPNTSITYEYPSAEGDPYYPIPRPENQALFKRYEALAIGTPDVTFVGRLATYRYYNMDQVVGQALAAYRRLAAREKVESGERVVVAVK